jgi:hypothetical protein
VLLRELASIKRQNRHEKQKRFLRRLEISQGKRRELRWLFPAESKRDLGDDIRTGLEQINPGKIEREKKS